MDLTIAENNHNTDTDTEEDDFTNYFMQSANLYNIKDKVKEANRQLMLSDEVKNEKKTRVHFSIDLCEYEPEFESNESVIDDDQNLDEIIYDEILEKKDQINIENDEEIDEEIMESNGENVSESSPNVDRNHSKLTPSFRLDELLKKNSESTKKTSKIGKKKQSRKKASTSKQQSIICEDNCLEFYHFTQYPNNPCLLHARPTDLPILKLHRPCCESLDKHATLRTPHYNGHNSEYGLTKYQLERKLQQAQRVVKLQEMRQMQLQRDHDRKSLENELHFATWLKRKLKQIKAERALIKTTKKPPPSHQFPISFRICQKRTAKIKPKTLEKTVYITFPFRDDNGRIFRINIDKMIRTELSDRGQTIKINVILCDSHEDKLSIA